MGEGLHSAYDIASIPPKIFKNLFGPSLGGEVQAKKVHSKSQHIKAANTNMYVNLYQTMKDATPFVMGGTSEAIKKTPSVNTLFGNITLCECEHCRSLYSPAAYLVDLLEFLNPKIWHPAKVGQKRPFDVLISRRPDLVEIPLTCDNTNIPLPYADLVNEILEYYVAQDKLDSGAAHDTANITAEELTVNPQYTMVSAYDKLKEKVYPLTLPFNRSLAISRSYLEQLGEQSI